ncbi:MAG: ATP-grasp domain-containing protein [Acetobacteraceae bacterium]
MSADWPVPPIVPGLTPPTVLGTAALAHRAFRGAGFDELLALLARPARTAAEQAALKLDAAFASQMSLAGPGWRALQDDALSLCQLFRVGSGFVPRSARPLPLLALVAPGDLMTNTPIDFITAHLDVQLDLLFVLPDRPLPPELPDHDVALFAVGDGDPAALARLAPLFRAWPRPALNDPAAIARLSRDQVSRALSGLPGVCSPATVRAARADLDGKIATMLESGPVLIRPVGSHAGRALRKIEARQEIESYLQTVAADLFFVTSFVDYRAADGLFRKLRVALIDGEPLLCHLAVSEHWMVHYLNAGMTEHESRRDEEARAMAGFDRGFAHRHAAALAAVAARIGLDYVQLDCAETKDGQLLIFEADVAAIVHLMDPPDLFPYKHRQMRQVFDAFDAVLRRQACAVTGPHPALRADLSRVRER